MREAISHLTREKWFTRTAHNVLLLKALVLVRFHFFSAAAAAVQASVLDEIDVRVLSLFCTKSDLRRKQASKILKILATMEMEERKNVKEMS